MRVVTRASQGTRGQNSGEFRRLRENGRFRHRRAELVETRKQNAHASFMRKHRIREAMEQMKISNKFVSLDDIIDGPGARKHSDDAD